MNKIFLPLLFVGLFACNQQKNEERMSVTYPETKKLDTVDTYFGTNVPDPYRWLEDDLSDETAQWVTDQNKITFGYLDSIPFRDAIKAKLEKLWNYEKVGAPTKHGDYYYFSKNSGLQNQNVLFRSKNEDGTDAEVFIDPNTFSEDGTVSMAGSSFTKDGSLFAHLISEGGSDWRKVIVRNTESNEIIEDTLIDVKFSGVSWKGNDGFYYSSYEKPKEGSQLSGKTQFHKLFYHKLGTKQKEDILIFGGKKQPRRYIWGGVTEDENYLIISASVSTSGNELYIQDLRIPNSEIVTIVDNFDSNSGILDNIGSKLFIETNLDAPNKRIVTVDVTNPTPENWKDLIPETKNVLSASSGGGSIFASYMVDVKTEIIQYDFDGKEIRKVELPTSGTAGGFSAKNDDEYLYYSFTSFTYPGTIFKFDIKSGKSEMFWKPAIDFNPEDYVTEQVFYKSKDGTEVPMYIVYKKGLKKNGNNPTYLYAYGGFNISLTPRFSISTTVWLDNGGIFAQANLRGGGEYGEEWHIAGTKQQKQNVFDDFIAAAEYLKENKYTSTDYLAIAGGSNGGLLVGATMTQRPDLAKVAFPMVGVLDMLRYHTFTAGAGWAYDYGTSEESEEMFKYLLAYSPLHNVNEVSYPATMVTTADHDDRVVPSHSFKFISTLQEKQKGKNPVIIRIETSAGHGAGTPTSKQIEQVADRWAFAFYNMGITPDLK